MSTVRLRVGAFHSLYLNGQYLTGGDHFDTPEDTAAAWLATGLVVPADGNWRGITPGNVPQPPTRPTPDKPPAATTCPCEPGPKPAGKRSMQVCPVIGCSCTTWTGKCRAHARTRADGQRYHDTHTQASAGTRSHWRATRRAYLTDHPWCEATDAHPPLAAPHATEVDHIDGLGPAGPRGHDWTNLQALCKPCHSRKTAHESFGH